MGMKDNLSDLFSEDGVEHAVVSEDHSSSGLGCIERDLKVTHADLIHHPEKKKASVRDSYKADPEKKKASVRDSYNADIESKQSAKRLRYQEDVEENRAAKRQKYEDNSDAIKASERNRYWNDPAVRLAKRAAERKRFRMGHRTTTTTQRYVMACCIALALKSYRKMCMQHVYSTHVRDLHKTIHFTCHGDPTVLYIVICDLILGCHP